MNNTSVMDQIIDTLTFEVEAIPQDKEDITMAPLKVKIKLRKNDKVKKLLQSVTTVPKTSHPKYINDTIQTSGSEQTLTSFEVFMTEDETMKKPIRKQKRVLYLFKKAGCLGTHIEDEEYAYSRSTSREANKNKLKPITNTSTNSFEKRNFILVKNYGSNEASHLTKGTHKDFLGKCKPGGCLDPPFSEEKYTYIPKIIEKEHTGENFANKCKYEQESMSSLTKKKSIVKSENDHVLENKGQPSSPISFMNVKKSNSIITYPSISSTELANKINNKRSIKEKQNSKDYTVSTNSSNKFIEAYYISPKKIKLNKANAEDSSVVYHGTIKHSFDIAPLQVENNIYGQNIPILKPGDGAISPETSLLHVTETNVNTEKDNSVTLDINSLNSNHVILESNDNLLTNITSVIYSTEPVVSVLKSNSISSFPHYDKSSLVDSKNSVMNSAENNEICAEINNNKDIVHTESLNKNSFIQDLKSHERCSYTSLREILEKTESLKAEHCVENSEIVELKFSSENYKIAKNEDVHSKSEDLNLQNVKESSITDEGNYLENVEEAEQNPYSTDPLYTVVSRGSTNKENNINVQGIPELFDKGTIDNDINGTNAMQPYTDNNHANNNSLPKNTIDESKTQETSSNITNTHVFYDNDITFKNQENEITKPFNEKQVIGVKTITNTFSSSTNNDIIPTEPKKESEISFVKISVDYLAKFEENEDKTNDMHEKSKSIENIGQSINSINTDHSKSYNGSILISRTKSDDLKENINSVFNNLPSNKRENMSTTSENTMTNYEEMKKINATEDDFLTNKNINPPGVGEDLQNSSDKIFHTSPVELYLPVPGQFEEEDKLQQSLIPNSININKDKDSTDSNDSHIKSFNDNDETTKKLPEESITTTEENKDVRSDSDPGKFLSNNYLESEIQEQNVDNSSYITEISSIIKENSAEDPLVIKRLEPTGDTLNQKHSNTRSQSDTRLIDLYETSPKKVTLMEDESHLNLKNYEDKNIFYLNMAFQSLVNRENKTFIKTVTTSSSSENKLYTKGNVLELNRTVRPGDRPVTIPIDDNNNLSIQIIKVEKKSNKNQIVINETSLTGHGNKRKYDQDGIALTSKSNIDNSLKNYEKEGRSKGSGNLQQTLDMVYDKNLVPLHKIIKNLRDDVDGLAKKKLIQDTLNKNLVESSRQASKRCECTHYFKEIVMRYGVQH